MMLVHGFRHELKLCLLFSNYSFRFCWKMNGCCVLLISKPYILLNIIRTLTHTQTYTQRKNTSCRMKYEGRIHAALSNQLKCTHCLCQCTVKIISFIVIRNLLIAYCCFLFIRQKKCSVFRAIRFFFYISVNIIRNVWLRCRLDNINRFHLYLLCVCFNSYFISTPI